MSDAVVLRIEGMTCGHCVAAVSRALKSVPGVANVDVSLEKKEARVTHSGATVPQLREAVVKEGYEVVG